MVNNKRKKLESIKDTIPFISKLTTDNLKSIFESNIQNTLDNTTGLIGIAVRLFGQQLIDKYFEDISEKKLENFGLGIYIKSAYEQIIDSLKEIDNSDLMIEDRAGIIEELQNTFRQNQLNIENTDLIISFNAKKHPAIVILKTTMEKLLSDYLNQKSIDNFVKHFNENIEEKIKQEFADDYTKHLDDIEEKWNSDREAILLNHMISLKKIKFAEDEDMKYQETYASWKSITDIYNEEILDATKIQEFETKLLPIQTLVEEYFKEIENINQVLFVVADFGKGKSVFLKQFAAQLSIYYQQKGEGAIPVYFNLREFDEYDAGSSYGVISDFLSKKFGLMVADEEFQKKDYFFLIDSLDECGSLTEERIDKVINSIKKIQNINPQKCRNNKIIITSRPIQAGLTKHMEHNSPYKILNNEKREISQYVSVYGFKKEQFNDYLMNALNQEKFILDQEYFGISKKIMDSIKDHQPIDIYEEFHSNEILTYNEIRRPIFSYMIYKLIISKEDISYTNKVGVYLSFVNLLTKKAKYKDEKLNINLKDEFRFRNILHSTAALWMYETHKKGNGFLKRQDISNTIESAVINRNDEQKIEKYREVEEVEFLSQSYFGQKEDTFYFQHQSFAEILLAEYYLKIFIYHAISKTSSVEECRIRLLLGNPSEQTIDFLLGLIQLLRTSVSDKIDPNILRIRKLLFPMLASLCTPEHSKGLYSESIKIRWFEEGHFEPNSTEPPKELLENWCITQQFLDQLISLTKKIVVSKNNYLITKVISNKTSLFDSEITEIEEASQIPPDIDRWLALLIGNNIYNYVPEKKFFASTIKEYKVLLNMMKEWNHYFGIASPNWANYCMKGIIVKNDEELKDIAIYLSNKSENIEGLNLNHMDFSYSILNGISFRNCKIYNSNFSNSVFRYVLFENSNLAYAKFSNAKFYKVEFIMSKIARANFQNSLFEDIDFSLCSIEQGVFFPHKLRNILNGDRREGIVNFGGKSYLNSEMCDRQYNSEDTVHSMFKMLTPFLEFGLKNNLLVKNDIKNMFLYQNKDVRHSVYSELEKLLAEVD